MIDWIAAHVGVPLLTAVAAFFALVALVLWLMLAGVGFTLPHWIPFAGGAHVTLINGAWEAEANAKRAEASAQAALKIQTDNVDTLEKGLNACNTSIKGLKTAGDEATAEARANLAKLNATQAALDAARRRLALVPKSDATCPSVDAIFAGAFQ